MPLLASTMACAAGTSPGLLNLLAIRGTSSYMCLRYNFSANSSNYSIRAQPLSTVRWSRCAWVIKGTREVQTQMQMRC
jgi:hypothetical protein